MRALFILAALLLVGGCASYGAALVPGQSTESDVVAALGEPTAVKDAANGDRTLWYSKLPFGRESYAARLDPRGTLLSFDQRLTEANFARLKPGTSTADDVFELLGPPWRRFKYPLKDLEAWEYPIRTWPEPQTLYVDVSPDGVVRSVYKLFDRDRSDFPEFGFGFGF